MLASMQTSLRFHFTLNYVFWIFGWTSPLEKNGERNQLFQHMSSDMSSDMRGCQTGGIPETQMV